MLSNITHVQTILNSEKRNATQLSSIQYRFQNGYNKDILRKKFYFQKISEKITRIYFPLFAGLPTKDETLKTT